MASRRALSSRYATTDKVLGHAAGLSILHFTLQWTAEDSTSQLNVTRVSRDLWEAGSDVRGVKSCDLLATADGQDGS